MLQLKCLGQIKLLSLNSPNFSVKSGFSISFLVLNDHNRILLLSENINTLLNVARALYFQSRISIEFWSDCILSAMLLINRTPSPLLKHQTPYQLLFKASPNYFSFRVFCCLAFASTLAAHRTKFQPWARVCVFIGYHPGIKGYKLYDI
ncbi:hypothetical protein ACOSP7_024857 [Xanthoceras sorbifolium]